MTTTNRPVLIGPPAQPERRRRRHRVPSWALKTAMAVTGARRPAADPAAADTDEKELVER